VNEQQKQLRLEALALIRKFGHGHSGRVLSAVDLIEGLYFGTENKRHIFAYDAKRPQWDERDFFVLSKSAALPGLYAVLARAGFKLPERLPQMPDRKIPGVDVTLSEQGYGLCAAVGLAQSIKMDRKNQHVFCLAGDYEFDNGKAWEAVMVAAQEKLDRLCVVLDENRAGDQRIQEKFEAFGWRVIKLRDAHDHDEIVYGYMRARLTQRKPTLIWAPTKKSAGVPFAERKPEYDDVIFSDAEMEEINKILI
jgi:transketolase